MSDLIDRQTAIDAIEHHGKAVLGEYNYDEGIAYGYAAAHRHLVDIVKDLPSAQPYNSDEWCEDCKEYDHEKHCCPRYNRVIRTAMEEAKPKTGRWEMKPDPYGFFDEIPVCSECGCTTKWREKYLYCPNCGARMGGDA